MTIGRHSALLTACCAAVVFTTILSAPLNAALTFTEVSEAAGARYTHGLNHAVTSFDDPESGGVAAGDFNRDGHIDLYIDTGDSYDNVLLQNTGAGAFTNVTAGSGVAMSGIWGAGPVFADINGDGWQDLLVGGMQGAGYHVFVNNMDGTFSDSTVASNITKQYINQNDGNSGLGDIDNDGDLDLFVGHHNFYFAVLRNHLWINDGTGVFSSGDLAAGITKFGNVDLTFAPTFVDINADGWQDLLITVDSGRSTVYLNDGDGTFTETTTVAIDDEFGMGSAPADFDNDGDVDWFVTSIHDHPDGVQSDPPRTGNRLYMNDGGGVFTDTSVTAGVRLGYWGWGACAADFDNDGWLDIFHVNGMVDVQSLGTDFLDDPSRLFLNEGDGTFTESSVSTGLVDTGQGRGIVCFDYDRDGDIDIFVFNTLGSSRLYRNDLSDNPGYLQVDVVADTPGRTVAGTVIELVAGAMTQTRHITVGSNFQSQNPLRQHFGLGGAGIVDQLTVTWPSGKQATKYNVAINQIITVEPEKPVFVDSFEDQPP